MKLPGGAFFDGCRKPDGSYYTIDESGPTIDLFYLQGRIINALRRGYDRDRRALLDGRSSR